MEGVLYAYLKYRQHSSLVWFLVLGVNLGPDSIIADELLASVSLLPLNTLATGEPEVGGSLEPRRIGQPGSSYEDKS